MPKRQKKKSNNIWESSPELRNLQKQLSFLKINTRKLQEKHRNQAIYHIQGNRNPFIDFPDLAEKLKISH